eukprot:2879815-Rhodomonas_salina.1
MRSRGMLLRVGGSLAHAPTSTSASSTRTSRLRATHSSVLETLLGTSPLVLRRFCYAVHDTPSHARRLAICYA